MKRWDLADQGDAALTEFDGGGYVLFEDIAHLERDYEATRAINVRLQAEVDRLKRREHVDAQHEETGRYWAGPRERIPPRFFETPEPSVSAQQAPQPEIGWQPIETAPREKNIEQLVYCSDTREQFVAYHRDLEGPWTYARGRFGEVVCRPTHWRPLPAAPKAEG
jgi:hypothetical protein